MEGKMGAGWVAFLFFPLVGPLAPLAHSIKRFSIFYIAWFIGYGLEASQANKQRKEAKEN